MIVFISNYLNHHQLSICQQFALNDEFYFIASENTPQERLNLGYESMNDQYDFVLKLYDSSKNKDYAQQLINTADIVIAASCSFPFEMIVDRLNKNKLTFWFSERLFKRGRWEKFYLPKMKRVISQCTKYRDKNFYLLSAGGYAAKDYAFYNAFRSKSFSWGYFPPTFIKESDNIFKPCNKKLIILWAARYIKWKHPEYAIFAAETLRKSGLDFEINMIGNGRLFNHIGKIIKKKHLEDCVFQFGGIPAQEVRKYMDIADIFIFTSDRNEGWGAVLNESMNSYCSIIANENIGSVKSVMIDGVNGITYKTKKQFLTELLALAKDKSRRDFLGNNAYDTVTNLWSAECAVQRFLETAKALKCNNSLPVYESGPMKQIG